MKYCDVQIHNENILNTFLSQDYARSQWISLSGFKTTHTTRYSIYNVNTNLAILVKLLYQGTEFWGVGLGIIDSEDRLR